MKSFLMQSLTAIMCAAALLTYGVAAAGEADRHSHPPIDLPAGYRVVQEDARLSSFTPIDGYSVIDADTIVFRTGQGLYLADLMGTCGRALDYDWTVGINSFGSGDIDRFAQITVNHRVCGIRAFTKVERIPGTPDPADHHE